MKFTPIPAMIATPFLLGCVPPDMQGLAFVGVRVPTAEDQRRLRADPMVGDRDAAILVQLSAATDIRAATELSRAQLSVVLVRCEGRTHVPAGSATGPLVMDLGLWDAQGPVRYGGDALSSARRRPPFDYWVPVAPVTRAHQGHDGMTGQVSAWSVDHDLRRDAENLCLYLWGSVFPWGAWRSNTVVIPYAAIRAALR